MDEVAKNPKFLLADFFILLTNADIQMRGILQITTDAENPQVSAISDNLQIGINYYAND